MLLLCVQVGQGRPHIFCDMRLVDDKGQELPRDGQAVGNLQVWCAVDALCRGSDKKLEAGQVPCYVGCQTFRVAALPALTVALALPICLCGSNFEQLAVLAVGSP